MYCKEDIGKVLTVVSQSGHLEHTTFGKDTHTKKNQFWWISIFVFLKIHCTHLGKVLSDIGNIYLVILPSLLYPCKH